MKTDRSQDKYSEIFQELKEEQMNWDFEDFLAQTEKEEEKETQTPGVSGKSSASFPKIYLMAASLVLLVSLGVFYQFSNESSADEQNMIVQQEIQKQKESFDQENGFAMQTKDSIKVSDSTQNSPSVSNDEAVMDKILPRRGRLKKQVRPHFAQHSNPKKSAPAQVATSTDYESNYVIINGQKIESEEEAIELAKYSFQILSQNVSKTVAHTDVLPDFNE